MSTYYADRLLEQMKWRYAVKQFDASKPLDEATWDTLKQAIGLSASSYGLQPWRFNVVTDAATKVKLREASWNQPQITDCSHLVIVTQRTAIDPAYLDKYMARIAEVRHEPIEATHPFKARIAGTLASMPPEAVAAWSARQCYIALGTLLTSAAILGVDACPMEGIEGPKYDELLGIASVGFKTLCVCALGYRSADDKYAQLAKVRFPLEDVVVPTTL